MFYAGYEQSDVYEILIDHAHQVHFQPTPAHTLPRDCIMFAVV